MPADGLLAPSPTARELATDPDPTPSSRRAGFAELRFRAMGVVVHLIVDGPDRLLRLAQDRIRDLDARWTRFDPASELSLINAASGDVTVVSNETYELIRLGVEGFHRTGGAFDPTVLGDVIRAGYDRDFSLLTGEEGQSTLRSGVAGTVLLPSVPAVVLSPGVGFDSGGLGKGLAADLVTAELLAAGADGACVNVGGDLRVRGTLHGGASWPVAVDHPDRRALLATFALTDGGLATSCTTSRVWAVGGQARHHLIDPRTGVPSASDLVSVSVVASTGWEAEVWAKAGLLAGSDRCLEVVEGAGATAIAVTTSGQVLASPGFEVAG